MVSFIDRIEIGEDNAIHFVFNNIETVHILEAIVEGEKKFFMPLLNCVKMYISIKTERRHFSA